MLQALQNLFTEGDSTGEIAVIFSQSHAKGAINLELQGDVLMVTRKGSTYKRKVTNQIEYCAKLLEAASNLYNMQVDRQALNARFIEYRDVEPEQQEQLTAVKKKILDLSLTIGTHPVALGVLYQESGKALLPNGVTIELKRVNDVFKFNSGDRSNPKARYDGVGAQGQISPQYGAQLNAVIVVKHRNLAGIITEHDFAIKDVLVVITAGFPSGATKEFLHLLANDRRLKEVSFLYFANHDMQGFSIYQTLKYGSQNSAWASSIMVCPQLQHVGPTKQDLLDSVALYRPRWEQAYREANPNMSEFKINEARSDWKRQLDYKIRGKFDRCTKHDAETLKAFEKLGWLEYEPLVKQEAELIMSHSKSKFRLVDMAQVNTRYIRQYFQAKLQEYCKNRPAVELEPPAVKSQILPSQASSHRLAGQEQASGTSELDEYANPSSSMGGVRSESLSPGARQIRELEELEIP
ncbi:MAG: hypothetical protein Q9170_005224 [Blastenia crenularia]